MYVNKDYSLTLRRLLIFDFCEGCSAFRTQPVLLNWLLCRSHDCKSSNRSDVSQTVAQTQNIHSTTAAASAAFRYSDWVSDFTFRWGRRGGDSQRPVSVACEQARHFLWYSETAMVETPMKPTYDGRWPDSRCSIKYLAVPNNLHLRHCACTISQSIVRMCLFI